MLIWWNEFLNFWTSNYYLNTIILGSSIIVLFLIYRFFLSKYLPKDKVNIQQKAEFRDKTVILRDKYELKVWRQLIIKDSKVMVIGFHGLQGQKDDFKLLANYCKTNKWSLIAFDRRGVGKNLDDWKFHSFKTDINDAKDVITAICDKYLGQDIILFGESIGASIAAHAAKSNPMVKALITTNLITKTNLVAFSFWSSIKRLFGFLFNSNVKLPIYIEPEEISKNHAYITNMNQRYSLKQVWSLKFIYQLKTINRKTPKIIRQLKQETLIIQSGDDVFSDFHQLRVLKNKWKQHQQYHFVIDGKHALINEPEMKTIFIETVAPFINKIKNEERPNNEQRAN